MEGGQSRRGRVDVGFQAAGIESNQSISVGIFAFDRVFQHRAGLRIDSDFVLRAVMANDEGIPESAAAGFLLEFLRDNLAWISLERGRASSAGLTLASFRYFSPSRANAVPVSRVAMRMPNKNRRYVMPTF
jgi:hypothetical protein